MPITSKNDLVGRIMQAQPETPNGGDFALSEVDILRENLKAAHADVRGARASSEAYSSIAHRYMDAYVDKCAECARLRERLESECAISRGKMREDTCR